jgi:hypothetical protein
MLTDCTIRLISAAVVKKAKGEKSYSWLSHNAKRNECIQAAAKRQGKTGEQTKPICCPRELWILDG